ncbi:MAG: ABC transporter permease [Chloroflexi bacterium]|nr:ABC transporter permease [Chloroflexota bacterium]
MFVTMVNRSLAKGWRKKALAVLTVALGTSLAVATLNIALDVGDKVNRELKSYGANILVTPQVENIPLDGVAIDYNPLSEQGYLPEADLPKLKMIFWKHNILGFAPYLNVRAETPAGDAVDIAGTWFQKTLIIPTGETVVTGVKDMKTWWQIEGNWPGDADARPSVLVGRTLAQK